MYKHNRQQQSKYITVSHRPTTLFRLAEHYTSNYNNVRLKPCTGHCLPKKTVTKAKSKQQFIFTFNL